MNQKRKNADKDNALRYSAKSRILAFALAVALLIGVVPAHAAEGDEVPDSKTAIKESLGLSLGASFTSLRSLSPDGSVLTIEVDGVKGVDGAKGIAQLIKEELGITWELNEESPSGITTPQQSAIKTLRIEVGPNGNVDDIRDIATAADRRGNLLNNGLKASLPNLIRLEIFFDDPTNSKIPGDKSNTIFHWVEELETNVEIFENDSFGFSDKLKVIRLENAITIGERAFQCTSGGGTLTELTIPKCETIGNNAFVNWTKIVGCMTIGNPTIALRDTAFGDINFYETALITGSEDPVSFFNEKPKYDFQSVNGVTFFFSQTLNHDTKRPLPAQQVGVPATIRMERINVPGRGPVTFSLAMGNHLPDGLELDSNGRIHGIPEKSGDYTFALQLDDGTDSYPQVCTLHIDPADVPATPPYVQHINYLEITESGEENLGVSTELDTAKDLPYEEGLLRIAFSQDMDKTVEGNVEIRWDYAREVVYPSYFWSNETANELTVRYENLEPGVNYWIYVNGFYGANNFEMTEVTAAHNYGFTTAFAAEQPQVTPSSQIVDVGETAVFHLSMGVGDLKADWAEIISFGAGVTVTSDTTVYDDCEVHALGTGEGVKELRINFYKTGEVSPFVSVQCAIYFRDYYKIEVSANPADWGTVMGAADAAPSDERHVVTAVPAEGYRFVRWSENGETVDLNASYYFTPERDRNLVAHFTYVRHPYQVLVQAEPPEGGTITGTADLLEGDVHTVTAEPAYGYRFVNWVEFEEEVSRDPEYTFTVDRDRYLTAVFTPYYLVEVSARPSVGGLVTGNAALPAGTIHTIVAEASPDFRFLYWEDKETGEVVSKASNYIFTITDEEKHFVAHFQLRPQRHEPSRISPYQDDVAETTQAVTAMALKKQIPSSAFVWDDDEHTLIIDHDNLTPADLLSVRWDGILTTAYSASAGSVILRFDEGFVEALSLGQHTVGVEFTNHYGEAIISVGQTAADGGFIANDDSNYNPETGGYATGNSDSTATGTSNTWNVLLPGSLGGAALTLRRRWFQLK